MSSESPELSKYAKQRIEKNRQRALTIKKSKLVSHPYSKGEVVSIEKSTIKIGATRYKDTGGGFLLEEPDPESLLTPDVVAAFDAAPIVEEDRPSCKKCEKPFATSWLFENFDYKCCDECKDPEEHKLITKTEAKDTYLLKDCDFDKREPPLKFITRKNPHNVRWGEMKLYLLIQVEERALEVWGSEEALEEEREKREEKKVLAKTKKYHKHLKELRMNMRSSLYDRTTKASHTHEFGPETYNEDDDTYTHSCLTCPYEETFEKM
ncbi:DNA repair protein complementing XP-A cells homolog [Aethina tumida]|uniref:DNA repair protein complementing XP-A cells homolog n=1 Tax=Aethina tumida TaxID=116153 RepID=UPI00096B585B|nr:DNA repair protein complementing XP-A cells homolog [Aethina tumida]